MVLNFVNATIDKSKHVNLTSISKLSIMSKRGRPPAIESQKIVEAIVEQSKEIVCSRSGSIIDKNNPIWKKISGNLHNLITLHSLYAYVTDDRYELKRKLFDCEGINLDQSSNSVNSTTAEESMNLSNNSDDLIHMKI
ncbi:hypothetical protein KQX54_003558 [Cotesia glomerata]|uniref:Uncharacterized protein n=1 Tax=Cotesia glomerata TaxID=32391 RepID=A0AAV7IZI9_COTGL|nr:hypothetical protein KQX54_003558 [Cotesia glomerata]